MKILVTGGKGFIGSHVVDRLVADGHFVIVIDDGSRGTNVMPDGVRLIDDHYGNIAKYSDVIGHVDAVVHLAAFARVQPSFDDPAGYFENNCSQLARLLVWANSNARRFIFASSSSVYGANRLPPMGFFEEMNPIPMSPYAETKAIGEVMIGCNTNFYGLPARALRFFNVYGDRMTTGQYSTAISKFLGQVKAGEPLTIFGDGNQRRAFTHVSDIVELIMTLVNDESMAGYDVYNAGGGRPVSVNEIADMIGGKEYPRKHLPSVPEPRETKASGFKVKLKTGWSPKVKIEDGLRELKNKI